jgi:hypothetical protein
MSRSQELQRMIRRFKEESGKPEWTTPEVAIFAVKKGYPKPTPPDPMEMLEKEIARAAREEVELDKRTGQPFRVNHAFTTGQGSFWTDIDAPRRIMHLSLQQRRNQMVGDAVHLTNDAERWNSIHPHDEPIQIELDFGLDVMLRKAGAEVLAD